MKKADEKKVIFSVNTSMSPEDKDRIMSIARLSGVGIGKFTYSALLNECNRYEKAYQEEKIYFLTQLANRQIVTDKELEQFAKHQTNENNE